MTKEEIALELFKRSFDALAIASDDPAKLVAERYNTILESIRVPDPNPDSQES